MKRISNHADLIFTSVVMYEPYVHSNESEIEAFLTLKFRKKDNEHYQTKDKIVQEYYSYDFEIVGGQIQYSKLPIWI